MTPATNRAAMPPDPAPPESVLTPRFLAELEQTLRADIVARRGVDVRVRALYALVVWLQTSYAGECTAPEEHARRGLPYCGRCGEWHGCESAGAAKGH